MGISKKISHSDVLYLSIHSGSFHGIVRYSFIHESIEVEKGAEGECLFTFLSSERKMVFFKSQKGYFGKHNA